MVGCLPRFSNTLDGLPDGVKLTRVKQYNALDGLPDGVKLTRVKQYNALDGLPDGVKLTRVKQYFGTHLHLASFLSLKGRKITIYIIIIIIIFLKT